MERHTSSVGYTYYNSRSPDGKSPSKTGTKTAPYSSNKSGESNKNLPKAKVVSEAQLAKMDVVSENKIWIETVQREQDLVKSWKPNWGFMTEFDQKGRAKVAAKLPEKVVMFSTNKRINTTSGEYGSYIYSPSSHKIQNLEIKFSETNRKKRLDSEFLSQ